MFFFLSFFLSCPSVKDGLHTMYCLCSVQLTKHFIWDGACLQAHKLTHTYKQTNKQTTSSVHYTVHTDVTLGCSSTCHADRYMSETEVGKTADKIQHVDVLTFGLKLFDCLQKTNSFIRWQKTDKLLSFFCQDAKQNRQIITVALIICQRQNTGT